MAQQAATAPPSPVQAPPPASAPASAPSAAPGSVEAGALPSHPRREAPRPCYGALDLGTNNCRLLIARPTDEGFTVIDAFSRVVRLGEGLATCGKISDEAQDRAVAALAICADKLRRRRVTLARSVATEACRRAVNGRQFVERVRQETGILLEIISPEEEARLAMLGCHRLLEPGDGPALIFDIGGGSTELVLVDTDGDSTPRIKCWWSAPWGVVSLTESEGRVFADAGERLAAFGRMKERVRHAFKRFAELLPADKANIRLLGTSGTVTTLASVYLALPTYDRKMVDGLLMPAEAMREVNAMLSAMSVEERAQLPCIGHDRADLVVAGCAILDAIIDMWPAETLGVADRGIREGILRTLMARDGHKL
jgi:exopolyphosphatase/guanosine-5'-triphosphate,3'-diphosphate pyrophosphatase